MPGVRGVSWDGGGCRCAAVVTSQQLGEDPQWLYTVRFTAQELWGSDDAASVSIDAFEPYLELA